MSLRGSPPEQEQKFVEQIEKLRIRILSRHNPEVVRYGICSSSNERYLPVWPGHLWLLTFSKTFDTQEEQLCRRLSSDVVEGTVGIFRWFRSTKYNKIIGLKSLQYLIAIPYHGHIGRASPKPTIRVYWFSARFFTMTNLVITFQKVLSYVGSM